VDPITTSDEIAQLGYGAHIGSAFEKEHGWHINLMRVVVPAPRDLLVPKLARGEPRDLVHAEWAARTGLC
jgi:hypothetical protein